MSGNWATGMRRIDSTPASVIRMAMTMASRGRSTKTAEITVLLSRRFRRRRWRGRGTRRHLDAGAHALDAFQYHHLAVLQAVHDDGGCRRRLAELDAALLDLVLCVD